MYGSHLSIAGGMVNALDEAQRLDMDCVQVFTKNQRQWRVKPLDPGEKTAWLDKLKELGWNNPRKTGPDRVVSHNSYLINMASPDPEAWDKSVALQRVELERCEELLIPLCVAHPGAHLGAPRKPGEPNVLEGKPSKDETGGLKRIVKALDRLHMELKGYRTMTCLETTVGSGTNLGYDFAHLAFILQRVKQPERVGICFDTCHVTAAGYDMTTPANAKSVLRKFASICGTSTLKVFHFNDSIGAVGSRKDRHAHIGEGECGESCFAAILQRKSFSKLPKILETPKAVDNEGQAWDLVNIRRLKGLATRTVNEISR
ncbi:MAG: deoxyribonuclease IV [Planctomycetota bacterium]|nr:deoxyribonuclease IV [Planctomycetota bacterium]